MLKCFFCGKLQSGAKYFLYQNTNFLIVLNVIEWWKNMTITVVKSLFPWWLVLKLKNIIINFINRVDIISV